jgi:kynureninase
MPLLKDKRSKMVFVTRGRKKNGNDPTLQIINEKVVEFFKEHGLTKEVLRDQYVQKVELLKANFLEKDLNPSLIKLTHNQDISENNGGFLSLTSPKAREIRAALLEKDIFTDARDQILRFGPAPYTTSSQITEVMEALKDVADGIKV